MIISFCLVSLVSEMTVGVGVAYDVLASTSYVRLVVDL